MAETSSDGEFGIIERYFASLATNTAGAFDLKDDAGLISPPEGCELVLTTDMIVAGVHYLESAAPRDIAYKALAVNVSDLCAKGATPSVYLLSIALPEKPDPAWLEGLSEGLAEAQSDFGCMLLGGDTVHTPGPATLSITAIGAVPAGRMVHRSGARSGDRVYVTGTIGDAALGLVLLQGVQSALAGNLSPDHEAHLRSRYWRPRLPVAAIEVVRNHASAAMDISDGLVGDFMKLCEASGTGGALMGAAVPLSGAASAWLAKEPEYFSDAITGGDDYEILMTVPAEAVQSFEKDCHARGLRITDIGHISSQQDGVEVIGADGQALRLDRRSYEHF
ncbi:thiamine-monophosphate kinase [bacterium BMS3Bbin10]|nr:thiamine-monophosphate kinase [bacterium BMS3Bbin10]